jgi:hypothetical protein
MHFKQIVNCTSYKISALILMDVDILNAHKYDLLRLNFLKS